MRVVLDTNILVRAAASPLGPAARVLGELTSGTHTLITSPYILAEVFRVLSYPRLQARWPLTQGQIHNYLTLLADIAEVVVPAAAHPVVGTDPDDDPVIQTSVCAGANVLCTRDRHLLDAAVVEYCERPGVRVMEEVELLRLLSSG